MRKLELGQAGDAVAIPQMKDDAGRWIAAPRPQKATRWKARAHVRGHDGIRREGTRFGKTRREAEVSIEVALAEALRGGDTPLTDSMALLAAGEHWLGQIRRPDSNLSARTIADYSWTWATYVSTPTSSVRGLTLAQANDPQRLRGFLQRVAEANGSGSAKKNEERPERRPRLRGRERSSEDKRDTPSSHGSRDDA